MKTCERVTLEGAFLLWLNGRCVASQVRRDKMEAAVLSLPLPKDCCLLILLSLQNSAALLIQEAWTRYTLPPLVTYTLPPLVTSQYIHVHGLLHVLPHMEEVD